MTSERLHLQQSASVTCSICKTTFLNDGGGRYSPYGADAVERLPSHHGRRAAASPGLGSIDASFVNIPLDSHAEADNTMISIARNASHIGSILDDALKSSSCDKNNNSDVMRNIEGCTEIMDSLFEHAIVLTSESNNLANGGEVKAPELFFYCQTCLNRIGIAIESCTERLDEECMVYDKSAMLEEERTLLLSKVLCLKSDDASGLGSDDVVGEDDDAAIERTIESFQYELNTLTNTCVDQEEELQVLQSLMQKELDRLKSITVQEDKIFHELSTLEMDAENFREESHLIGTSCAVVEGEIDAMSRVRLMSMPFDIKAQKSGYYPTINNLRLAYRINENAGLYRDEINAAFSNAAQLISFAIGLYPSLISSAVRIIPIRPCAKILVNLPEGQSIHSLGFDTTDRANELNHVPSKSITLFLVLLSELSSYIMNETNPNSPYYLADRPPFDMKEMCIDNVDVTKLADSDVPAWSSALYCIAANLRWLSELEVGRYHSMSISAARSSNPTNG